MTAENTPSEAPDNAVSDFLYSGAPGEGATPANARERRYAEAIGRQRCEGGANWLQEARAAIAIADGEQAALNAENERLRRDVERYRPLWSDPLSRPDRWRDEPNPHPRSYISTHEVLEDYGGAIRCSSNWSTEQRHAALDRTMGHVRPLVYEVEHLRAEVEQLKDEVVRTNDRFAKARVRNGQLRARAEAAERARDEVLARESRLREAVEGLADEWAAEGVPCDCGHGLDTHNGLGCYERLSYKPLVTCECEQTDDRHDGQLAALILRALLAAQEPPAATEDTPTEQGEVTR